MTVASGSFCGGVDVGDDKVWPPGFRFHPTDEELVLYYLKKKICQKRLKLDVIRELDVYKWDPEDLPGQSILKTGDRQWFFFTTRDRKYPNGGRSNRATTQGYWKATGKDRNVMCGSRNAGVKKTLVFYRGRAPNGERTDWVMHEYTLDEEELKRCPNVKDYYALYKVFKKSGAGPKNGEQYGAPFKEEDWDDEECVDMNGLVTPVKQSSLVTPPVGDTKESAQIDLPSTDLDNFLKLMADEKPPDQSLVPDYTKILSEFTGEQETQSTLMDPLIKDATFVKRVPESASSCRQDDIQANMNFNQSAPLKLHSLDAAESTSCEDDFLEIDDLLGPEPTTYQSGKPAANLEFGDFDGLCELDLYHDAAMFLSELGPADQETGSYVNEVCYYSQPHSTTNQVDHQLQPQTHSAVNDAGNVDYLPGQAFGADQFWLDDLTSDVFNTVEPVQETQSQPMRQTRSQPMQGTYLQPTPGVTSETRNNSAEANQNQSKEEGWISSTLWDFLDSIPTTPASASENPFVNRAFERMSSFSRMKLNVKNSSITADNTKNKKSMANTGRVFGVGGNGFIFLSIIGALCAILWVLIGAVRVLGRAIS